MALEIIVDRDLCIQAADRALAYLRERVLDDTWVAAHRDIAYYFKAPQAFLLAGLGGELDTAGAISEYLLSQQRAHGGFADDAGAMDTVDQTAELACWLRMLPELAAATQPISLTVAGF